MITHHRFPIAAAGLVLCTMLATACDGLLDFGHSNLSTDNPPPPPPSADDSRPAQTDAAVTVDPPPPQCQAVPDVVGIDYQAMCRHYCDTLDETLLYTSLASGQAPLDASSVSDQCWQLRCVPHCVDQALCFTQCDAAGKQYTAVCANADAGADNPHCPSTPDDHLAVCRAGCSPALPTP